MAERTASNNFSNIVAEFFDLEAGDSAGEESLSEIGSSEHGFIDNSSSDDFEVAGTSGSNPRHLHLDANEEARALQAIAEGVERRARDRGKQPIRGGPLGVAELLPSDQDPEIWLVRVENGKEWEVCSSVLQRHILEESKWPKISSVFTRDHLQGFIFVEAANRPDVEKMLRGMQYVKRSLQGLASLLLVSLEERVSLLSLPSPSSFLGVRWVRIKRSGPYKNDLAFVRAINNSQNTASVYLVPRISTTKKRKRGSERPPAALFNVDEVRRVYGEKSVRVHPRSTIDKPLCRFKKREYKFRLLEAVFALHEISRTSYADDNELHLFSESKNKAVVDSLCDGVLSLRVNDKVKVFRGVFAGFSGTLSEVRDDQTIIITTAYEGDITAYNSDVRKYFECGDLVRVLFGKYSNTEGHIVAINSGDENDEDGNTDQAPIWTAVIYRRKTSTYRGIAHEWYGDEFPVPLFVLDWVKLDKTVWGTPSVSGPKLPAAQVRLEPSGRDRYKGMTVTIHKGVMKGHRGDVIATRCKDDKTIVDVRIITLTSQSIRWYYLDDVRDARTSLPLAKARWVPRSTLPPPPPEDQPRPSTPLPQELDLEEDTSAAWIASSSVEDQQQESVPDHPVADQRMHVTERPAPPLPGQWMLNSSLLKKRLDVRIVGTVETGFHKGRYEGKGGYVIMNREPQSITDSFQVKIGVNETQRMFQLRYLVPEVTTWRERFVSAEDAVPIIKCLGQRVVIIGPDLTGNSVPVGYYGHIVDCGFPLREGHAYLLAFLKNQRNIPLDEIEETDAQTILDDLYQGVSAEMDPLNGEPMDVDNSMAEQLEPQVTIDDPQSAGGSFLARRSERLEAQISDIAQRRWTTRVPAERESSESLSSDSEDNSDLDTSESEPDVSEPEMESEEAYLEVEAGERHATLWDILAEDFERESASIGSNDLSEEDIWLLRAYNLKVDEHLTDKVFERLRLIFPSLKLCSLKVAKTRVQSLSGFQPVRYDCCPESCICYTGPYEGLRRCPNCQSDRYAADGKAIKYFEYLPIVPRLKAMVSNTSFAKKLRYRHDRHHNDGTEVTDIFDGTHYKSLLNSFVVNEGNFPFYFFSDPRDLALGLSTDGFAPFKRRRSTAWPLILFNYNLPPEERMQLKNIIALGVIPGPKKPWDIDSFLWPLIQELTVLATGVTAFDGISEKLFQLHAYLIVVFGDIPAVSMLMRMKGHNAISPCRMCTISGVRVLNSRVTTHYVPLNRQNHPTSPGVLDPNNLTLRTHASFIAQAAEVDNAPSLASRKKLATEYGIKGTPILSSLSSLSFPVSFPYDFMHLIWENLIPNLVLLWTGEFKDLNHSTEDYVIQKAIWNSIGEASAAAGQTIPAAYGARVPNVASQRHQLTAETQSIWTLYLAPTLLSRRFQREAFYVHFSKLVKLLNLCLQLEISAEQIDELDEGFKSWVLHYEQLYYKHDLSRASVCPVTIHALLHIAPSIRATGPVWTTWAFPTERYCGKLLRSIKSRRHPYISLSNYVTAAAQLNQIKLVYDLQDKLTPRASLPTAHHVNIEDYPDFIFLPPRSELRLSGDLWLKVAACLATRYGKESQLSLVRRHFPENTLVEQHGRCRRTNGGDTFHCSELITQSSDSRDSTWVRYESYLDRWARQRNRPSEFILKKLYGRLLRILILKLQPAPLLGINSPTTVALAVIRTIQVSRESHGLTHFKDEGQYTVIDLTVVKSLVGRIKDRNEWTIVDRGGPLAQSVFGE